jgi:signal transduction histidine kinase
MVAATGAALVAFVVVYPSFLMPHSRKQSLDYSLVIATVGAVFIAVGMSAWRERPHHRVGVLMVAVGFGWLSFQLSWLPGTVAWMWQYVTKDLELPFLVWLALAYPTGVLRYRVERVVVALGWLLWAWGNVLGMLSDDTTGCRDCSRNIFFLITDPALAQSLQRPEQIGALVLAGAVVALILRHWWRATSRGRRSILPLVWMSGPPLAWFVVSEGGYLNLWSVGSWLYPWFNLALTSVPLGYVYTRVRDRLVRGGVGDLIVGLGSRGSRGELRQVLAKTLHDPTLEVAFWMPEERRFADLDGREVVVPKEGDPLRTATVLERDGEPLAMIVHDAAVSDDPKLVAAATAAVSMAVENERLHALVRAQLDEVRASRARIVAAQDDERRRLERDLHDGAQQRLVTLALALGEARSRVEDDADPSLRAALDSAAVEVGGALSELRDLALGIHPAVLSRAGLVAALQSLSERAPLPVVVKGADVGRLPAPVEAAGYFVVSELLTNIAKHARASTATVCLTRDARRLNIVVSDDGVGGADASRGSGLRGLADRVRAVDGQLTVTSPRGRGTTIVVDIPCA